MLRPLDPGEFVQGTIFTCGLSDSYPNVSALGMLITARCDIAQNKAAVYNYVPVVPVEAWIERDGFELVARRALASSMGTMRSALADAGMATSVLDFIDYDAILTELQKETSKQFQAIAKRFAQAAETVNLTNAILGKGDRNLLEVLTFLDANEGLYKSVIKELMTNALAEFHYLEKSDLNEKTRGYVAIMREIRFMSADLGRLVATGLSVEDFGSLGESFSPALNHIRFSEEHDFAMPLSCVASPFIEFIMQRFANLFSRIGVEDTPKELISEAHSWVRVMQEAAQ